MSVADSAIWHIKYYGKPNINLVCYTGTKVKEIQNKEWVLHLTEHYSRLESRFQYKQQRVSHDTTFT